jgi:hypothetical protein
MPLRRVPSVPLLVAFLLVGCQAVSDDPSSDPFSRSPLSPGDGQRDPLDRPSPAATPTPAPVVKSCTLPPGTGSGLHCPREHSSFLPQVEAALDQLVREEPEVFELPIARGCPNCYRVLNPHRLTLRVVQILEQQHGLCAKWDGEEVAVKGSNAFSDQYDILTYEMYLRRQEGSYRATCYPAWF